MKTIPILLGITLIVSACITGTNDEFTFEIKESITNFPNVYHLEGGTPVNVPSIGIIDIAVKDSLLLLSSINDDDGYLSVYDPNNASIIGSGFKKGRAGGEFNGPKSFGALGLTCSDDGQKACTIDGNGDLVVIDIEESLNSGGTTFDIFAKKPGMSAPKMILINDSTAFVKSVNTEGNGFERSLLERKGNRIAIQTTQSLDCIHVQNSDKLNIISTLPAYNNKLQVIAEACLQLSLIHLYSIDGNVSKTLITGNSVSINQISKIREQDIREQYLHICAKEQFFAALKYDASEKEQLSGKVLPCIQLFDWDGNPLCEYHLPIPASTFDIDVKNKELYVFDRATEMIIKFNLNDL